MNVARRLTIMIGPKSGVLWIAGAQIVQLLSGFLILAVLTRTLSISSFGYYSLCITIVMFSRQVLYDPVSVILAKNSASLKNVNETASRGFWVLKYLTDRAFLSLCFAGTILFLYFKSIDSALGVLMLCCFIYLAANGAFGMYVNVLNAIRERKNASIFLMADTLGKLFAIILAVFIFKDRLDYIFMGISFSAIVLVVFLRGFISKRFRVDMTGSQQNFCDLKSTVIVSLPLIIPSSFMALKMYGDRWILAGFMGVEELAGFSVLLQVGYLPMILILGVIQTYVAPNIYNLAETKNPIMLLIYLKAIVFKIVIFSLAIAIVSMALSGWIFGIMVGDIYQEYSYYLPTFVVSGAATAISTILYVALIACFSTQKVAKMATMAVFVSLVSTFILVALIGFLGAVVGLLSSSIAIMFFYWYSLHSHSYMNC